MEPKQKLELQRLYQLSKHQLSDLIFLHDEMKFIKSLIFKYFLPMMHDYNVNRIQLINSHLSQLNLVKANVSKELMVYQGQLNSNINGLAFQSTDFLKLSSERINDEIKDLNKSFKNIKREIFTIYKDLTFKESLTEEALV